MNHNIIKIEEAIVNLSSVNRVPTIEIMFPHHHRPLLVMLDTEAGPNLKRKDFLTRDVQ